MHVAMSSCPTFGAEAGGPFSFWSFWLVLVDLSVVGGLFQCSLSVVPGIPCAIFSCSAGSYMNF